MDVFLSYSHADKKVAERLREALEKRGLSVWSGAQGSHTPSDWRRRIEEAIHSAREILVLLGSRNGADEEQDFTWRTALEAVWGDPRKRLIPILLRGAELPTFVRSGSSGELRTVRVEDSRDMTGAAQTVLELIQGQRTRSYDPASVPPPPQTSTDSAKDSRSARLSEIAEYAERMRSH